MEEEEEKEGGERGQVGMLPISPPERSSEAAVLSYL